MRFTALPLATLACTAALLATSCSSSSDSNSAETAEAATGQTTQDTATSSGIRLVPATEARMIQTEPADGLVVLDVRTAEEFAQGHLEGAVVMDFYDPGFAAQLAQLDPDASYLLYCQSGNRSGQTSALMEELGFSSVAEVDGGILAWAAAGQPVVTD